MRLTSPGSNGSGRLVLPHGDGDLDLDRASSRQGGHTDGRAGVAPGIPEDLEQDMACSVDDGRLLVEAGGAGHVPGDGEHPLDPVEAPEGGAQYGQRVEGADPSRLVSLLDGHVVAKGPEAGQLAVDARKLPGRAGDALVDDDGVEGVMGRMGAVEDKTERGNAGIKGHGLPDYAHDRHAKDLHGARRADAGR